MRLGSPSALLERGRLGNGRPGAQENSRAEVGTGFADSARLTLVHFLPFHEFVFLEAHRRALGHWLKPERECFSLISVGKIEVNYMAAA